jgi:hypothetical protein
VLAAVQRPVAFSALIAPSGDPAWKTIPSWYLVGTADNVIPPAEQRVMAERAHAHTVEVRASHLAMVCCEGAGNSWATRIRRRAAQGLARARARAGGTVTHAKMPACLSKRSQCAYAEQLAAREFRLGALDGLEFLFRSVGHQPVAAVQQEVEHEGH